MTTRTPPEIPNIFLIVVDCLRADRCPEDAGQGRLVCWPKLLERGSYFTQMVSAASVTPVCFGSLLTGQYSMAHGIRTISGPALNPHVPTLAGVLKEMGYSTHAFVTGPLSPIFGLDRGFDRYDYRPRKDWIYSDWGRTLIDTLETIFAKRRWFVLLHLFELHYPRQVHKRFAPRRSRRRYDYAWEELDEQIDRLVDRIGDNSLILLTSDHGERLSRPSDKTLHGFVYRKIRKTLKLPMTPSAGRDHGFHVYDELTRIPFCISGPGVPRGTVIRDQVGQIDIMPTILDLIGGACPLRTHGRSLKPLLEGKPLPPRHSLLETGNDDTARHWIGLRSSTWKYVRHAFGTSHNKTSGLLFDLHNDPKEKRNLIRHHPDIAEEMDRAIDALLADNPLGKEQSGRALTDQEQAELHTKLKSLGYL